MCGITGIISPEEFLNIDKKVIYRMIHRLSHRGPDETGLYIDKNTALGHARLSIIDLSTGQQPLCNEDERYWIVFNGEIFNYLELAQILSKKGHTFRTKSDTEIIVHAYEQWGEDCVKHFNGQFAFAIWDSKEKKAFLARDRVGICPLYFFYDGKKLVFSSEVKSILTFPDISKKFDYIGLGQVFTFWAPIPPRTVFREINQIPVGHSLSLSANGDLKLKKYWSPTFPPTISSFNGSIYEATEILKNNLLEAAKIRLRADVPVGAYLSGGIDSSVITCILSKYNNVKLESFSLRFTDSEFDEGKYQREVAQFLETKHHEIECSYQDIGNVFFDVIKHTEQPVLRTAPAPMYILSSLVRSKGYKVVLTGEGSDEALGGYDIFREAKVRRFVARDSQSSLRIKLFSRLYPWMVRSPTQSAAFAAEFFSKGMEDINYPRFSHIPRWQSTSKVQTFLVDSIKNQINEFNIIDDWEFHQPEEYKTWDPLCVAQYVEMETLLGAYLLSAQGDRMLMGNSVEGRFPFLDHNVIEFANSLPPHFKLCGLDEKHILKKMAADLIPKSVLTRPKQPYRAPDAASFFFDNAPDYIENLLSNEVITKLGVFNPVSVERLIKKCRKVKGIGMSNTDNMAIVGILSTQIIGYLLENDWSKQEDTKSIDREINKM